MKLRSKYNDRLYTYEENIWTGTKKLYINGVLCSKMDKKSFIDPETKELITLQGSFLSNIKLKTKSGEFYLAKNSGFDWTFIVLSFIVLIMSIVLFSGAIGGGLGGALAVLTAMFNTSILRSKLNKGLKALYCSLIIIGSCLAWWLIYSFVIVLIFM